MLAPQADSSEQHRLFMALFDRTAVTAAIDKDPLAAPRARLP
jgi:hypothetical protein